MRISLTALTDHGPQDVVITCDPDTTVARVAASLIAAVRDDDAVRYSPAHAAPSLWMDGRSLDPAEAALTELRDGAVVAIDLRDVAGTMLTEPSGGVEIRISGGPTAGAVHRVGIGSLVLGTGDDVNVRLDDPTVPARALRVMVEARRVSVEPMTGGAEIDGTPLTTAVEWPPGGVVRIGASVLTLALPEAPDVRMSATGDGGLTHVRRPRTPPREETIRLTVPAKPARGRRQRFRPRAYKKALKDYQTRRAEFEAELERSRREDEANRRAQAPDPAEILLTATGPRRRLWERRPADPDTLRLRIGVADLPAHIELGTVPGAPPPVTATAAPTTADAEAAADTESAATAAPTTADAEADTEAAADAELDIPPVPIARTVPVRLPLTDLGMIGLAGPRDRSRALARWLIAQSATLHSPRDLAIVVLSADADGGEQWNWVRWLPHCAPHRNEECVALVGTDQETVASRVTELAIRVTERRRAPADGTNNILLVLDGARLLRRVPGMSQILAKGAGVGLYAICIDDDERLLPDECGTVALWDWDRPAHVRLRGQGLETFGPLLADQVSVAWCDRLARALAPVRAPSVTGSAQVPPDKVRLLDVFQMPNPSAEQILSIWSAGGRGTVVPIGADADGVFSIDVLGDGPHVLVAGAAGTGKSELLRTLIASLAVINRPDEMNFLLIDPAAFQESAGLPHTVQITNGVLERLDAEARWRDELLQKAGAENFEDYARLRVTGTVTEPLPRLVVAVDEFAEISPDLAAALTDIAQWGEPLGIHVIVATRRPTEVVPPAVSANANLRIDLGGPASSPGRCSVRPGAHQVQAARITTPRPGPQATTPVVQRVPWAALGRALPRPRTAPPAGHEPATTDLAVLVAAVRAAAARLDPADPADSGPGPA